MPERGISIGAQHGPSAFSGEDQIVCQRGKGANAIQGDPVPVAKLERVRARMRRRNALGNLRCRHPPGRTGREKMQAALWVVRTDGPIRSKAEKEREDIASAAFAKARVAKVTAQQIAAAPAPESRACSTARQEIG